MNSSLCHLTRGQCSKVVIGGGDAGHLKMWLHLFPYKTQAPSSYLLPVTCIVSNELFATLFLSLKKVWFHQCINNHHSNFVAHFEIFLFPSLMLMTITRWGCGTNWQTNRHPATQVNCLLFCWPAWVSATAKIGKHQHTTPLWFALGTVHHNCYLHILFNFSTGDFLPSFSHWSICWRALFCSAHPILKGSLLS